MDEETEVCLQQTILGLFVFFKEISLVFEEGDSSSSIAQNIDRPGSGTPTLRSWHKLLQWDAR